MIDTGAAGWNGYRYWMAYTPYPGASRENPSIVASNDMVTWMVPAGLSNPLFTATQIQAAGYYWGSDACLCLSPDRSRLEVYWRPYKDGDGLSEAVYRKTSTTGSSWGTGIGTRVLGDVTGTTTSIISPSVIAGSGDARTMWVVDRGVNSMVRRSSTDGGLTWDAGTVCTIPASIDPWHVQVTYRDGIYHALLDALLGGGAHHLVYLTSTDGLAWTGSARRAVPLSGTQYDSSGRHYRSAMVPASDPGRWHVFVAGIPDNGRTGTLPTPGADQDWRLMLYRNLPLGT